MRSGASRLHSRIMVRAVLVAMVGFACLGPEQILAQPIPCSEPGPAPSMPPEQELRRYTGFDLTVETSFDQVVAALGPPGRLGPAGEMMTYSFGAGDDPQLWLWLSFERRAPRRLTRAVLQRLDRPYCMLWATTVLLNNLDVTKARRRDQLDMSRRLSAADVYAAWGPPDSEGGSGLQFWLYAMANGETEALLFDGDYVQGSGRPRRRRGR